MRGPVFHFLVLFFSLYASAALAQMPNIFSPAQYSDLVGDFDWPAHSLDVEGFVQKAQEPDVVVLDLRSHELFERGHVQGAQHIGPDITKEKLAALVPNTDTTILTYCSNSLALTRTIALTNVSLPQIHALGYENLYMLEAAHRHDARYIENPELLEQALNIVSP
jgi:hypothetical protein